VSDDHRDLERWVQGRVLRASARALGLTAGLLSGSTLFVATNWLLLKGDSHPGPHLGLLGQYLVGYTVTFRGSLIGFAYAFLLGFGLAYAGALLYNRVVDLRHGTGR